MFRTRSSRRTPPPIPSRREHPAPFELARWPRPDRARRPRRRPARPVPPGHSSPRAPGLTDRRPASRSRLFSRCLLLLCSLLPAACQPPKPNYLFVEPTAGAVEVQLREEVGAFERREVPVPLADCGFFAIVDPGADPDAERLARLPPQEIWRVTTLDPDVTTLSIRYGVVPPGFVQVQPQGRAAPLLVPGDRYVVECTGFAIGVTEFRMPYPEAPEGYAGRGDRPPEP